MIAYGAPPPEKDRAGADDAGRRSMNGNQQHHTQDWPRCLQQLRLAQMAHHPDPLVRVIATAVLVLAEGGAK